MNHAPSPGNRLTHTRWSREENSPARAGHAPVRIEKQGHVMSLSDRSTLSTTTGRGVSIKTQSKRTDLAPRKKHPKQAQLDKLHRRHTHNQPSLQTRNGEVFCQNKQQKKRKQKNNSIAKARRKAILHRNKPGGTKLTNNPNG
jgi:hypothetical protein